MNTCCRAAVMLWLSTIGLLFGASTLIAPAFAGDPWGTWYTKDNESQIRITNCGGALCGSLVWLQEPNNPTNGEPLTDRHNPDPNKQSRPLLQLSNEISPDFKTSNLRHFRWSTVMTRKMPRQHWPKAPYWTRMTYKHMPGLPYWLPQL